MHRVALERSLHRLLEACAVAALLTVPGCGKDSTSDEVSEETSGECWGGWDPPVDVELVTTGTVVSLTHRAGEILALMREGKLLPIDGGSNPVAETLPAMDLRAWVELAGGDKLAVGDGGQLVHAASGSSEWEVVDAGITDDLLDVIAAGDSALAIANNRMFFTTDAGMTWTELPGAWTGLRRVFRAADEFWLIGDGGQVWTTTELDGSWTPVELGTTDALLDGHEPCMGCVAIVSAQNMFVRTADEWLSIPVPEGEAFVALGDNYVVTDKALHSVAAALGTLSLVMELDFTPSAVAAENDDVYVAGSGGELVRISRWYCLGRPWVIDGAPRTAMLVSAAVSDWARDGLYEHASVASFARFISELLALGAPPALVREAQAAILDELEHARLCFELAAREHGLVRIGPLPLDRRTTTRAGDPVALALAVFEEGCLGESIAAIEAGVAAAEREDPDARRVLERIAADERQHAALAWRTLRWLVDEFGEPVRVALRRSLAQLDAGGNEVRARTVGEIIRPLAALLATQPLGTTCVDLL